MNNIIPFFLQTHQSESYSSLEDNEKKEESGKNGF
jgi:hypothetical protein